MADHAAVPAPFAIPPPPAVTFSEFYLDANNDPYGGDYEAAMLTFRDGATPNTAAELSSTTLYPQPRNKMLEYTLECLKTQPMNAASP